MAGNNQGPGCLYVQSKISKPDILDENTFLKWYDEHHIPDMLRTSAVKSAFRFQDIDSEAGKPYLVIYPLNDLGFLSSDEFRNVSVQGDPLPGAGNVFDMADFDARFDSLIQVYDPTEKGKGVSDSLPWRYDTNMYEAIRNRLSLCK